MGEVDLFLDGGRALFGRRLLFVGASAGSRKGRGEGLEGVTLSSVQEGCCLGGELSLLS